MNVSLHTNTTKRRHSSSSTTACSSSYDEYAQPIDNDRTLRFSPVDTVHTIVPAHQLVTPDQLWYTAVEYHRMKKVDIIPAIKRLQSYQDNPKGKYSSSFRGLEYRTRQGAYRRSQHKMQSISAVLWEQACQQDEVDESRIRQVYMTISVPCQQAAYQLGLEDEQNAQVVYSQPSHKQQQRLSIKLQKLFLDTTKGSSTSESSKILLRAGAA